VRVVAVGVSAYPATKSGTGENCDTSWMVQQGPCKFLTLAPPTYVRLRISIATLEDLVELTGFLGKRCAFRDYHTRFLGVFRGLF
jgi:hypothetical protein